jgi:hypothetical protein
MWLNAKAAPSLSFESIGITESDAVVCPDIHKKATILPHEQLF